jgi:hypothetical protein
VNPRSVKWQPGEGVVRLTDYYGWGHEVRFEFTAPFEKAMTLTADMEIDCGLAPTMMDIPPLGAAASLMRTTESRRANIHAQGDTRRAGEVPPGTNTGSARETQRKFEDRIADEYVRLLNGNPWTQAI